MADGFRVSIVGLGEEVRKALRLVGLEDVRARLVRLEEFQRRVEKQAVLVQGPAVVSELTGQRLYTQEQVDELVAAARAAASGMIALDPLDDEVRDRRARAMERELEGIYMGRRGRQAGPNPDDVWCRGCGRAPASVADGSLCGDCGDVA